MRRTVRGLLIGLALVALTTMTACAEDPRLGDTAPELSVPTWDPPSDVRALSITGRLLVDEAGCLRLDTGPGSGVVTPVWPQGFSARRDGEAVTLTSASGDELAGVGQTVTVAGGSSAAQHDGPPCGAHRDTPAFEVDQFVRSD